MSYFIYLFIYFVFLHTIKDKHENCCYILKLIIGIKYIKTYSWNLELNILKVILGIKYILKIIIGIKINKFIYKQYSHKKFVSWIC
jgi:hypothetical protein